MARINLTLNRFVVSNWIFKARKTALHSATEDRRRSRRRRLPVIFFSVAVLIEVFAVSAAGQLSIIFLEKNRRRVALPTTDVTRIAGATRGAPQAITVVPMNLEVGDVLVGNSGVVAVRIRCNFAEAALSGKFRVRMLPSPPRDCNLYFEGSAGARISTTASGPTNVVSGAFTLGTRRTRYEIEIPDKKGGGLLGSLTSRAVMPIAKVYEGEARVNSPGFSGAVKEGQKLVAEGLGGVIRKIAPEDYQRAAQLHAELDVSQASLANEKEIEAAYKKLLVLHRDVLEKPHDAATLTALRTAQQELSIPASDVQPPPPPANTIELSLKPNEKGMHTVTVNNDCKNAITFHLIVNNTSFVRLVSPVDVIVSPGKEGKWQLEYDATGLNPGTYNGEVEITCVDCANKQCPYVPQIIPLTLKVL